MNETNESNSEQTGETNQPLNGMEQFDLLRNYLDKKFIEQKQEFDTKLQLQQKIKNNMKVSAKPDTSKQFKFKGNQVQHEFNMKLAEDIEDVIDLIKEGSVSRSTKRLTNMKLEIVKRNKLIKMADRSPAGWATVEEYLSDDLASDSGDEKRIKSAESKALAKKKVKSKPKSFYPSRFNPLSNQSISLSPPASNHFQSQRFGFPRETSQPSGRIFNHHTPFSGQLPYRFSNARSMCFGCGKTGHWRKDCPNTFNSKQD